MSDLTTAEAFPCDTCRSKPGAQLLCNGCLENRQLITKLTKVLKRARGIGPETERVIRMEDWLLAVLESGGSECPCPGCDRLTGHDMGCQVVVDLHEAFKRKREEETKEGGA